MTASDERYVATTLGIKLRRATVLLRRCGQDAELAIETYRKTTSTLGIPKPPPAKPKRPATPPESPEDSDTNSVTPSPSLNHDEEKTPTPKKVQKPVVETDQAAASFTGRDFILPQLTAPEILTNGGEDGSGNFVLGHVLGAIQNGENAARVHNYLAFYSAAVVKDNINGLVCGVPAIFYVVQSRDLRMIRLWAKYGGDVKATATFAPLTDVPLMVFAAGLGGSFKNDATEIIATLLSLGALPASLPRAFFSPFQRDLPVEGPPESEMPELAEQRMSWCTADVRNMLAARLNLRQRYYLNMASLLKGPGVRARQVTAFTDADNLLGVSYFLIGQTPASQFLIKRLLRLLARPSKVPAVMVFAGPSGHGKTELARQLGELLSLEMETVDCTNKKDETGMFGARNPYVGSQEGSPLNNFLVRKAGQRCIAFLDEFEKTTKEVHETLLLPFQNGEYEDRRTRAIINSSKTIWILATNTFDGTIHSFCKRNEAALCHDPDPNAAQKLMRSLCKTLRAESIEKFGAPLTGRISDFIPFLTFSEGEQACVAHKYLTEAGKDLAKPVAIARDGTEARFIGDVDLLVPKDYSICRIIAEEEYHVQLGARSVISGVNRLVRDQVEDHFLGIEAEIVEGQGVTTYRVEPNRDDEIEVCFVGVAKKLESGIGKAKSHSESHLEEEDTGDSSSSESGTTCSLKIDFTT